MNVLEKYDSFNLYNYLLLPTTVTQEQLTKFKIDNSSNAMFFIIIATVFIAAIILNELIEKPFLNLRKKLLAKKEIVPANAGEVISV